MQILIVHPSSDFRDELQRHFEGHDIPVHSTSNARQATMNIKNQNRAKNPYEMVVIGLDLARDHKTAVVKGGAEEVIALLSDPDHGHSSTKCVVLCPGSLGSQINLLTLQPQITLLDSRGDVFELVVRMARDIVDQVARRPKVSVLFVQDPHSSNWQFWLKAPPNLPLQGALRIPDSVIEHLGELSEALSKENDTSWLAKLADIGRQLHGVIFENNIEEFRNPLLKALQAAGGIEKARFSFNVRQETYRVALEALLEPQQELPSGYKLPHLEPDEAPFLMLKAPICRTFSWDSGQKLDRQSRQPLFYGPQKRINCLLIEADTSGEATVPGAGSRQLPALGNVRRECDWLETQLKANSRAWNIGLITRVGVSTGEFSETFRQQIEKAVENDDWQLVHYAGHTLYTNARDGNPGKGYFFLPGKRIETVSADRFSEWLPKAQFLFLSSCHSSEENFVLEMVRHGVPSVLGFRWDIEDSLAAEYAEHFYRNLFKFRLIEAAFVAARNEARNAHRFERIWAAPMLMLLDAAMRPERRAGLRSTA